MRVRMTGRAVARGKLPWSAQLGDAAAEKVTGAGVLSGANRARGSGSRPKADGRWRDMARAMS